LSPAKRVLCAPDGFTEPTEGSDLVGRDSLSCHTPAHTFALFCAHQKFNSFLFKRFRTLCKKHPGVGTESVWQLQVMARNCMRPNTCSQ
jgi:hypothetical protein